MPMPRKYTPKTLQTGVDAWFRSITRTETVYEELPTGDLVPAVTDDGEPIKRTKYLTPPVEEDLCIYLGISMQTWERYGTEDGYAQVIRDAKNRIKSYLKRELLTRDGKNTRGVEFTLSANYGMAPRTAKEVDLGPTAAQVASRMVPLEERADLLKDIAKRFGGDGA